MNPRKIELKNVKKGDVFYECESGENAQMKALADARRITSRRKGITGKPLRDGYTCRVQTIEGKLNLYEHIEPGAYGLRLYTSPEYI